jgi:membrane protein DedA with SNARE-associated domain
MMTSRGGLVIVAARYLPGGRSVTAFTAGIIGYPAARFAWYTALALLLWYAQAALLGYWGGTAFADHPLLDVAVASTVAALATMTSGTAGRRRALDHWME